MLRAPRPRGRVRRHRRREGRAADRRARSRSSRRARPASSPRVSLSRRLRFVVGAAVAARGAEFVFLCVQTPQGDDGSPPTSRRDRGATPPDRAGPPAGRRGHQQVDGAGRDRRVSSPAWLARGGRHARRGSRIEPGVPARGHRGARLPPPAAHRHRLRRRRRSRCASPSSTRASRRRSSSPTPRRPR